MKYLSILRSSFQKTPYLIFFVTAKCNSRCKMCFYWKNLSKKQNELKLEEIEKILLQADAEIIRLIAGNTLLGHSRGTRRSITEKAQSPVQSKYCRKLQSGNNQRYFLISRCPQVHVFRESADGCP